MPSFVRILKASDIDDAAEARADRLNAMLNPDGWSLFAVGEGVTPVQILGAYFGMRRGKQPAPCAYRLLLDEELTHAGLLTPIHAPTTDGRLPPGVAKAHHDLFLRESAEAELLDQLLSARPVQELALLDVLAEQVRIHNDEQVIDVTRKNIRERIEKMGKQLPEVRPLAALLRLS